MDTRIPKVLTWVCLLTSTGSALAADSHYWVCVSNERSGDVSIIDSLTNHVIKTIPVGKRPRGIHASPDGRTLYVALSGRPIEGPPQLDAKGNPILKKNNDDDDDDAKSDHAADGIGVIDIATMKFVKKLPGGSDPEQFAVAPDGKHLYIANEDVATISALNIEREKVDRIVLVKRSLRALRLRLMERAYTLPVKPTAMSSRLTWLPARSLATLTFRHAREASLFCQTARAPLFPPSHLASSTSATQRIAHC